jgi:hypothetical protein
MEVREIKTISKPEMLDFYEKFISAGSAERRKIACHVVSTLDDQV